MEFFTAPGNLPFSIALAVVLLLGALEVLSLLVGGASNLVGVDGPDGLEANLDGDADVQGGPLGDVLAWLHAGQIPSMILLMLFLLGFALGGFALQMLMQSRFGALLPAGVAILPAGVIALFGTRVMGGILKPLLPRDETEAVSLESFVGCAAHINVGTARRGQPTEARLTDQFGRTHYVLVEPEGDEVFPQGSAVLIIKRHGHVYQVIDNTGGDF
jgi:hypothetical protein